ncbi:MAG: hypothetical protein ABSA50_04725 [Candidatus Bathyarchaeia archaeon]
MELDALETRAVELLRSRLQNGNITTLSAERSPSSQNQITVHETFQDAEGRERRFEVKFQIKEDKTQIADWSVS